MAETRAQSMIEMKRQLEEVRKQSEERAQELEEELAGIKEIRLGFMSQKQAQANSSLSPDPGSSVLGASNQTTRRTEPPDLAGIGQLSNIRKPSDIQRVPLLSGGLATRISKVEFPKFDGTLLKEWIYKCEQFFLLDSTAPELKVRLSSLHMKGKGVSVVGGNSDDDDFVDPPSKRTRAVDTPKVSSHSMFIEGLLKNAC